MVRLMGMWVGRGKLDRKPTLGLTLCLVLGTYCLRRSLQNYTLERCHLRFPGWRKLSNSFMITRLVERGCEPGLPGTKVYAVFPNLTWQPTNHEWSVTSRCGFHEEEPAVPQARPGFPGWKDLGEVEVSYMGTQLSRSRNLIWWPPSNNLAQGTEWQIPDAPESEWSPESEWMIWVLICWPDIYAR